MLISSPPALSFMLRGLVNKIQNVTADTFEETAIDVFRFQYDNHSLYKDFTDSLHVNPSTVGKIAGIPFLPVSFFKTHQIIFGDEPGKGMVFQSSTTTGSTPSRHFVKDVALYRYLLSKGFRKFYGEPSQYAILALLPSYLERGNSSLVYMVNALMEESGHPANGFYLYEHGALRDKLAELEAAAQPTLLVGVTYALLDFAESYPMSLKSTIVMETGGMKGRREEMTREEVHDILKNSWQLDNIHSEYGMTELLSQAYSKGEGIFRGTDTLKVLVRDINDPLDVKENGAGAINIIDLGNIYSCSFIATEDIATVSADGSFRVLGRLDHSALRGCSLMAV